MKTRIVFIAAPLAVVAVALTGGFALVWRLAYLAVLALLLCYAWVRLTSRGIAGEVTGLPDSSQVGEDFEYETAVINRSRIPKYALEVREDTDLPGYRNMLALSLPARSSRRWRSRVTCQRRGRYNMGRLVATLTDPLGLFRIRRSTGESRTVLVYPATVDLPFFSLSPQGDSGHAENRWFGRDITSSAARIREYTNGDNFSHIHWRSTARTGRLMVKTFDPERPANAPRPLWIVADLYAGFHAGSDSQSSEEYAVTIAASLAKRYIESGVLVGMAAAGDQPCLFMPEASEEHLWRMMDVLAIIRATGHLPVEQVINGEMKRFEENSALVVVTPSASPHLAASLRHAQSRGITTVAVIIDPMSFGGTSSAIHNARRLAAGGMQVYIVRRGEQLATALDGRFAAERLRHAGESA